MVDRLNRSQVSLDHVAEENEGSESHNLGSIRVTERGELNIANLRNFDRLNLLEEHVRHGST